jgi:hypothetical protein
MKILTFIFLNLFLYVELHAQDNSFENKMNRIYKSSYSAEVSDQLWEDYISSINTRTYKVIEGDTLWGLSEVFFGDGFFWSKIWSYNKSLTNPHLIKIGQEISFFTGSINLPPSLSVNGDTFTESFETNQDIKPNENHGLVGGPNKNKVFNNSNNLYPGAPIIPPSQSAIRPVLKNIPPVFEDSNGDYGKKYNEKGISLDIRPPIQVNPLFVAYTFLFDGSAENYPRVGEIIESENGNNLVSLNDQIYLRSKENLKTNEYLTIMGQDYNFDRNGINASIIRYMARIRILKKIDKDRFLAEVVQSYSGVKPGSWVSRETIPKFSDDHNGRPSSLVFNIIGGGSDNVSRIYGQSDIVYLSGGSKKGLRVGDVLGVYKVRELRMDDSKIRISPTPIAHIKVLRAEPNLSSAFVISSREAILPGDETGSPSIQNDQMSQSEKDDLNEVETSLDIQSKEDSKSF